MLPELLIEVCRLLPQNLRPRPGVPPQKSILYGNKNFNRLIIHCCQILANTGHVIPSEKLFSITVHLYMLLFMLNSCLNNLLIVCVSTARLIKTLHCFLKTQNQVSFLSVHYVEYVSNFCYHLHCLYCHVNTLITTEQTFNQCMIFLMIFNRS